MRSRSLLVVVLVLVLLGSLAGVVYAYDQAHRDQIAKGMTVGGVDVGGLTGAEARARLQRAILDPLRRPIVVRHAGHRWRLRARQARIAANLDATIEQALARSRDGNPIQRAWRGLTDRKVSAALEPDVTYSDKAVARLLDRVRAGVDRPAKDATVKISGAGVAEVDGQTGLTLRERALGRRIRAAIADPTAARTFLARAKAVSPKVTRKDLAKTYETVVVVNRGAFKLTLFKALKAVKTYPIAVGQIGLETPAGLYTVQNKAVNPAWHVPQSTWAGDLAGKVIPGDDPSNPIKARWLGIYDGVGIHGTSDDASIGSAASHGCIRMHIGDVEELYPRVPLGASVYIA